MLNYHELRQEYKQKRLSTNGAFFFAALAGVALWMILLIPSCAHAEPLTEQNAILSIIGEGESEGFTGLYALACAIKNKGNLKGVYGLHSPRVKKHLYSQETYALAKLAWEKAKTGRDITFGATVWGNKNDVIKFRSLRWFRAYHETFRHKGHIFYALKA